MSEKNYHFKPIPMKKFRATSYGLYPKIEELEVIKETEKQIVFIEKDWNGRGYEQRNSKNSKWDSWHDTHAAAKDYLIEKQMSRIGELKLQIEKCKETIEKIKEL